MKIEEIERLVGAATPGPWREGLWGGSVVVDAGGQPTDSDVAYGGRLIAESVDRPNRAFIIASRMLVERLVAVAREAKRVNGLHPDPWLREAIANLEGAH